MALKQSSYAPFSKPFPSREAQESTEIHVATDSGFKAESQRQLWPSYEPGIRPISDFGSLNTVPRSEDNEDLLDVVGDAVDDLDSLDEGLHAFREPATYKSPGISEQDGGPILPVHDGLGSFQPARTLLRETFLSSEEHMIHSKSELPKRADSRFGRRAADTESLLDEPPGLDRARLERIEKWRFEQSQFLLKEIERESRVSQSQRRGPQTSSGDSCKEALATPSNGKPDVPIETIWQRFTRHIMLDLIGIDDTVLCAIFGEDLLAENELSSISGSKSSQPHDPQANPEYSTRIWESRIVQRLLRELQRFAKQISPEEVPLSEIDIGKADYAGIPLHWLAQRQADPGHSDSAHDMLASAQFLPTIHRAAQLPLLNRNATFRNSFDKSRERSFTVVETEYWEQSPNLKTVFHYLYHRFNACPTRSAEKPGTGILTSKNSDALRRVAIIQQHHPLVSRALDGKSCRGGNANSHASRALHRAASSLVVPNPLNLKRAGSSCASWSTKRSRRNTSEGASRNYWDLGESFGSGSMYGGVGTWGEV